MIAPEDIRKKMVELFSKVGSKEGATVSSVTTEFLLFLTGSYGDMDESAKKKADELLSISLKEMRMQLEKAPAGPLKMEMSRQLKRLDSECPTAEELLSVLSSARYKKSDVLDDGVRLFAPILQSIMDLLADASDFTHRGGVSFGKMALLYSCVHELAVASHLAQRAFTNQVYSHTRTVLELCDKIDLFQQKPEEFDGWLKGRGNYREYLPGAVRVKLGRPGRDPIYSMMSELGPHGTFDGIRLFTGKELGAKEGEPQMFRVWIGGCYREDQLMTTHVLLLISALMVLFKVYEVYRDKLNAVEVESMMLSAIGGVLEFHEKRYLPWAKENAQDVTELQKWMAEKRLLWQKWKEERERAQES